MAMTSTYASSAPARAEIDALEGPAVIEFGAPWCGYCQAAQPALAAALHEYPRVQHIKIEDGPGRRLGRTFGVKLWPTLIYLSNGREVARLVRPDTKQVIREGLAQIAASTDAYRCTASSRFPHLDQRRARIKRKVSPRAIDCDRSHNNKLLKIRHRRCL